MSTSITYTVTFPSGTNETVSTNSAAMLSATNLTNTLATDYAGISATVTSAPSVSMQPVAPQMISIFVDPNDTTITPVSVGAYTSIIYKVGGAVVSSGFSEPGRPYTLAATFVLVDGATIDAGNFTIPIFYIDYQLNPLVDTLFDAYQLNTTFQQQYLENRILPPSYYFTTVIINPDFGGSNTNLTNRQDTHIGWWLHKDTLTNNNIDYTEDFSILLDIHVLRSTSYEMQPKEMFGFDFNYDAAAYPGGVFFHAAGNTNYYMDGPQFRLDHNGMNLNPNGGTANNGIIVTQNNAGVPLTGIRWSDHNGGYETTSDGKTFIWPFWGGLLSTSNNAFQNGSNTAAQNGYAGTKYYCVVQVKQEEKIIVKFYSHPDGLGSSNGPHSVADEEFFHCEFQYPEKFSRDYVAGFVSTASLHYNKIVVTNRQNDLLNVLRNTGTNDTYTY